MKFLSNLFVLLSLALYLDFLPSSYLLKSNGEATINLFFKIPENYLQNIRVKVKFYEGSGFIFNPQNTSWTSSNSFWTEQPLLNNITQIKVLGNRDVFKLSFLMQDTKTGIIYESPVKKLWARTKLNDTILNLKLSKSFTKP